MNKRPETLRRSWGWHGRRWLMARHDARRTPEHVAEKIAEAVETEAAEVYADSIRPNQ
jgi:hypothetical protein